MEKEQTTIILFRGRPGVGKSTVSNAFAKERKIAKVDECILRLDALKFIVSVAWEGKLISNQHCEDVALKLEEVGKMFYGWKKNLENPEKKNRNV